MPVVARKKRKSEQASIPEETDQDSSGKFLLRFPDPQLKAVMEDHATAEKRSLNLAIIYILEQEMRRVGLWPPKS